MERFSYLSPGLGPVLNGLEDEYEKIYALEQPEYNPIRTIAGERWQEATGRKLVWPDHADLCVWLMGRLAELEAKLSDDDTYRAQNC